MNSSITMDVSRTSQAADLLDLGTSNIDEVIDHIKGIENAATRYEYQQDVLDKLIRAHEGVSDTIEKFYLWMQEDRAYESQETTAEFEERHANAGIVVEDNAARWDRVLEASAELVRRWGSDILSALTQALRATRLVNACFAESVLYDNGRFNLA